MVMRTRDAEAELSLPPGFRFHPTDEELVVHYLCRKAAQQTLPVPIIAEIDLYKFDPWQLPEMALFGNKEWYFFTPRDRKYPNGSRPNRAAGCGYWKATGADKPVTTAGRSKPLGIKKALVFYAGKAPKGAKTNWIMHEYRLADADRVPSKKGSLRLDDWVLCRLYNKKSDWKKDIHLPQVSEDASFASSFEAVDDVAWDSRGSPISDVDNDVWYSQNQSSNASIGGGRVKEDDDWFMDLKLEDLSNPFEQVTGMLPYLDNLYYPGIASPVLHRSSSLLNLMMPF